MSDKVIDSLAIRLVRSCDKEVITRLFSYRPVYQAPASITAWGHRCTKEIMSVIVTVKWLLAGAGWLHRRLVMRVCRVASIFLVWLWAGRGDGFPLAWVAQKSHGDGTSGAHVADKPIEMAYPGWAVACLEVRGRVTVWSGRCDPIGDVVMSARVVVLFAISVVIV